MTIEKPATQKELTLDELQAFINDPRLDLPATRRDISKPENVRWLIRNIWIRNQVPATIIERLRQEMLDS